MAGKRTKPVLAAALVVALAALLIGGIITQSEPGTNENTGDTQTTSPREGENREWTPERMKSASPAPMPRMP